jgi:Putative zinc-finger
MNCDKAKSLLGWFFDGELSASDSQLVAEHVEHCPECAAKLAALADLESISRHLPQPAPSRDLWDQIARRLPGAVVGKVARPQAVGRRRFMVAAGVLAASVVGGLVTYRITRRGTSEGAGTPPVPIIPSPSSQADLIVTNLALLDPEDRRLAQRQRTCAAVGCSAPLGAGGTPVKIVLQGTPVFACCKECGQWARNHPTEAVAKVHTLELQHEGKKP